MTRTVILQAEPAECGLACLAMVASHHGMVLPLRELRRRFPLSLKGASLSRLLDVARRLGLTGRALRLELGELAQLRTPCLLHWDLNHFVVLEKANGRGASIIDPASGSRRVSAEELSRHFTGVALELSPAAGFKPERQPLSIPLRHLAGPVSGLWRALAVVLALSLVLQAFVLLAPFFMQ